MNIHLTVTLKSRVETLLQENYSISETIKKLIVTVHNILDFCEPINVLIMYHSSVSCIYFDTGKYRSKCTVI